MPQITHRNTPPPTFSATMTERTSWGDRRTVTIEWMAQRAWDVDAGLENLDLVPLVWGTKDEPPAFLMRNEADGMVYLESYPVSRAGTWGQVFTAQEVAADEELTEGTFRVVADTSE